MFALLKKLGPGILFAGAAIGVSHIVMSTRAGADFGLGLLWALLLVHLCKYPFFLFGAKYAAATGESLIYGYYRLGKGVLLTYFILNIATIFTIQTAVTIVTAGIADTLFGDISFLNFGYTQISSIEIWTVIILAISLLILFLGNYKALDKIIKLIIFLLTLSTLIALFFAYHDFSEPLNFTQITPKTSVEMAFLVAFMGWMPAPLDVSIWHSIWAIEKQKENHDVSPKSILLDFNMGYFGAMLLGIGFLSLGYFVMYGSDTPFSPKATLFASQLIEMYTSNLGQWAYIVIGIAVLTTMFSTTLTTLDASPRAMNKSMEVLTHKTFKNGYLFWIVLLTLGTLIIFFAFASEMGILIKTATVLSFLTAPFYAFVNYRLICSKHTPETWRPKRLLHLLAWLGIIFLIAFSLWYVAIL
ncbi:NRAMP family divalent metal transporter [Winogradskyella arenosi]|uniref:Mn2+/Fe2+ NRAMP family transporter n=1 Tax=Winogradskyella arenosi TaxID=533325 RepID=A0A368ZEW0_9FLAO|nr:divalent metal cation transporter [Winogradskyella arenosi]RCW90165.1 Mn2+/Fe2+ NRAMP family transporter [Winogradskyella arenosi]